MLTLIPLSLLAQEPSFWNYTDEDGLSSLTIYDINQDSAGYLWLGTERGLLRFNGVNFQVFNPKSSRSTGFSRLCFDGEERLWFQNFSGQLFYLEGDSATAFKAFNGYGNDRFNVDRHGDVWISSANSKNILHFSRAKDSLFTYEMEIPGRFMDMLERDGDIWIGISSGVFRFSTISKQFEPITDPSADSSLPDNVYIYFGEDYFYTQDSRDRFYVFDYAGNLHYTKKCDDRVCSVLQVAEGRFLLGFQSGLKEWNCLPDGSTLSLREYPSFDRLWISDLFQDREKNIWVSTLSDGLFMIPEIDCETITKDNSTLPSNLVRAIISHRDKVYLNIRQAGMYTIDSADRIIALDSNERYNRGVYLMMNEHGLIYDGGLIFRMDNLQEVGYYTSLSVKDLDYTPDYLFIATGEGAYYLPLKADGTVAQKTEELIRKGRTRAILADSATKSVLIAFYDGLFQLDSNFELLQIRYNDRNLFISVLKHGPDGSIWLGSLSNGLYRMKGNSISHHFTTQDGLLSNSISDIEFKDEEIWIATDKGIQTLDTSGKSKAIFNSFDGLISNEVIDLAFFKNKVYAATTKGISRFRMDLRTYNNVAPPILLKQVTVNGVDTFGAGTLDLRHQQNNLQFLFSGISLKSRGKFTYRYRTLGIDSNWVYLGPESKRVILNALKPGTYKFELMAVNEDGLGSSKPASLGFTIDAPYWQKAWFYMLLILSIFALTSLIFLVRIRIIRRNIFYERQKSIAELEKAGLERELRSSRLISLKAQLNPHFIFNALNSIQDFILLNERTLANRYLGKFSDLMRLTLDMSNQGSIRLADEISSLNLYLELESLRFEDSFFYNIELDQSLNPDEINIPSLLIQPYVENAIKHGLLHKKDNRKLWVRIKKEVKASGEHLLLVEIEDNGVGRSRAIEIRNKRKPGHRSFATGANQRRLELLNSENEETIGVEIIDLFDDNKRPSGTRVIIRIPLKSAYDTSFNN